MSSGRSGTEVTIFDVADAAGVSIRTVSRVINKSPKVNDATRERVTGAISKLGFQPSARARGLATGRSYLIGLVHNDRNALVLDPVQRGIVAVASARGYELVVHPAPAGDTNSIQDVVDFVQRSRVDGVVVMAPVSGVPGMADALRGAHVPAAALSAVPIDGFEAMMVTDERAAAALVARHLVDLGHTRIAIINGPLGVHSATERRHGFVEALAEAGLSLGGEAEGDYGFDTGLAAAEKLLALEPRPTAIFAVNDIMAAAVIKAATARGMTVPRDLSVVGFDGSFLAAMSTPALTTVWRPMAEMAGIATQRLLDLLDGVETPNTTRAELSLVIAESTAPPA